MSARAELLRRAYEEMEVSCGHGVRRFVSCVNSDVTRLLVICKSWRYQRSKNARYMNIYCMTCAYTHYTITAPQTTHQTYYGHAKSTSSSTSEPFLRPYGSLFDCFCSLLYRILVCVSMSREGYKNKNETRETDIAGRGSQEGKTPSGMAVEMVGLPVQGCPHAWVSSWRRLSSSWIRPVPYATMWNRPPFGAVADLHPCSKMPQRAL